MFKKALLATATAGLIAAGATVATTGTASAEGIYMGGPGWSVGIGNGPYWHPGRECRPIFRTVRWWDQWGGIHFRRVYAGQDCRWYGPRRDWHDWRGGDWNGGYWRGPQQMPPHPWDKQGGQ